jgi:hypothetical protein
MKFRKHAIYFYAMLTFIVTCCIEPYQPPAVTEDLNLLVVDGFVNCSTGSASIRLSHSIKLSDKQNPAMETGAQVSIKDSDGIKYLLTETDAGTYTLTGVTFDLSKTYQLHIQTIAGKEYQSASVPFLTTPPLDSVTWKPEPNGVSISVNAHDETSASKYYQWHYTEVWAYTSKYGSSFKVVNGVIITRPVEDNIYYCWGTEQSRDIMIGTSQRLSEDVISDYQVTFVPAGTIKLTRKYSILVQQQAITKEGYDYLLQLKKTTESLGGLFDPLPSQVTGNISCVTDPSEIVLGYFSGATTQSQRIFIDFKELPRSLQYYKSQQCEIDTVFLRNFGNGNLSLPIGTFGTPALEGYLTTDPACVDCRLLGGSATKPDFWIE